MNKNFLPIVISSCFLFSCNNSNIPAGKEEAIVPDSSIQQNMAPSISSTAAEMPETMDSGTAATSAAATPSSSPGQAAPSAAGMNPAHGEPNHRCDIPVGAPLDSPPTKTAAPGAGTPATPSISPGTVITPSGAPGNAPVTAVPTATPPGMNPPHGQPGHDCAVAVGAPLKK